MTGITFPDTKGENNPFLERMRNNSMGQNPLPERVVLPKFVPPPPPPKQKEQDTLVTCKMCQGVTKPGQCEYCGNLN